MIAGPRVFARETLAIGKNDAIGAGIEFRALGIFNPRIALQGRFLCAARQFERPGRCDYSMLVILQIQLGKRMRMQRRIG